jgi:hypothetical protein
VAEDIIKAIIVASSKMVRFIFFRYFDHKVNNFVEKNKENREKNTNFAEV